MPLYLSTEFNGSESQIYLLRSGMLLGRDGPDVKIPDSRVSSPHALIRKVDQKWVLSDLQSSNGTFSGGQRITEIEISVGTVFVLGKTTFKVISEVPKELKPWKAALHAKFVELFQSTNVPSAQETSPFPKIVSLCFVQGPLSGKTYELGFGPRTLGRLTSDLPLFDPDLPPLCLRIFAQQKDCLIQNLGGDKILLNGRTFSTEKIYGREILVLGAHKIEVNLV